MFENEDTGEIHGFDLFEDEIPRYAYTPRPSDWKDGGMPQAAWDLLERVTAGEKTNTQMAKDLGVSLQTLRNWEKHPTFLAEMLKEIENPDVLRKDAIKILAALKDNALAGGTTAVSAARAWQEMLADMVPGGLGTLFAAAKSPTDDPSSGISEMTDEELARQLEKMGMTK